MNSQQSNRYVIQPLSKWMWMMALLVSFFTLSISVQASPRHTKSNDVEQLSVIYPNKKRAISFTSCLRKYKLVSSYFTGKYNNIISLHNQQSQVIIGQHVYWVNNVFFIEYKQLPVYPQEDYIA